MACLNASVVLVLLCYVLYGAAGATYSVTDFGAKPDGQTDAYAAFNSAWSAACRAPTPATVYVPNGNFLLSRAVFTGPCSSRMTVQIVGTLVAPPGYTNQYSWILFDRVNGLAVSGGTIDGRGQSVWACKAAGHGGCANGARSLTVQHSSNVVISGLRSVNSEQWHIVIDGCQGVTVSATIMAPGNSPNTDGIHVQGSSRVTVTQSLIKTGDDCVSVGPGTDHLRVEHVTCGPGHGISIGSLGGRSGEKGVENVTVTFATMVGTLNGVRIKTWANTAATGSYVRGVVFENVFVSQVSNPIIIDQHYCPNHGCPSQESGVKISDVTYSNVWGSSATPVAVNFDCSASNPCTGIQLQNIKLALADGKAAQATCKNAQGTVSGVVMPPSCLHRAAY